VSSTTLVADSAAISLVYDPDGNIIEMLQVRE